MSAEDQPQATQKSKHVVVEDAPDDLEEDGEAKGEEKVNPDGEGDHLSTGQVDAGTNDLGFEIREKKKKKKKKKAKGTGKGEETGPSGFEDNYAEAPLTVEEHQAEVELYSPSKFISTRIETAVQRFAARRKFNADRNQIWTLYMQYGGIKSGNKMFGGIGKEMDAFDKEDDPSGDAQTLRAREFVGTEIEEDQINVLQREEESKFTVDFDGIVRAFFSMHLPGVVAMDTEEKIKGYTSTIRSWLNYLLHHNVCDEYRNQILDARSTCDRAERELWSLEHLRKQVLGEFNQACRAIYSKPRTWDPMGESDWDWDEIWDEPTTMDRDKAERAFLTALAGLGDDALIDRYRAENETGVKVSRSFETGLEITRIELPTNSIRNLYDDDSSHGLLPMGRVCARTWYRDWEPQQDLTEEEEAALPAKREAERREYEFWIDEQVLQRLFVGLKLTARVSELSFGLFYLDKVFQMYTSFVTWLPNELMSGWRDHEWIEPNKEKMLERMHAFENEDASALGE